MISEDDQTRIYASIALGIPKDRVDIEWTPEKSAEFDRALKEINKKSK
jgi:hypothetical protein